MRNVWLTITAAAFAMALLFAALANGNYAAAQTPDTPTPFPTIEQHGNFSAEDLAAALAAKKKAHQYPNMDSNLNRMVQQVETGQFTAQAAAESAPVHSGASVAVTLYITEGYADAISNYLTDNGGDPRNIGVDYIEAYIPVPLLPDVSQQEGVISVRTIIPPQPAQGAVVSEGVAAHGAPAWHIAGIKGQGVKIGVIDDFEGFSALMGTELPSTVTSRCYTDIGVFNSNRSSCETNNAHGTAVTETIFDIAPEATYYISNPGTLGDLKTAVEWMVSQDVDVINMSSSWRWEGPGDGTTPFSFGALRSVDTAVNGGTTWVNATGNYAERTWFGSSNRDPFNPRYSFRFQIFDGNQDFNNCVELERGDSFSADLRWEDTWGGARRDLDLSLFQMSPLEIVAAGNDLQFGLISQVPNEYFRYTATAGGRYCLVVVHYNSNPSVPSWIQLRVHSVPSLQHHTISGSIASPAESANPGLLAVGASNWSDTREINYYSSRGPTPDGRIKPDIVGTSGGQTETLRAAGNPNGYFAGTSASSSHVAGLAALVKQNNPSYTPQQVAQYLKNNAVARGTKPNNTWGYGFAMLPASDATPPTPRPHPRPLQPRRLPLRPLRRRQRHLCPLIRLCRLRRPCPPCPPKS